MPTTAVDKTKSGNGEDNAPSPASERKPTLLVVEDDENISSAISEYFSRAGYSVQTAEDGLAGVQSALNEHPDAIILDLRLQKMDGLALCRELREHALD